MIRLLGMLVGSVVAVAALILLVGVPDLATTSETEPVDIQLPLDVEPLDQTLEPVADVQVVEEQTTEPLTDEPPLEESQPPIPEPELIEAPDPVMTEELHWYAFWSPFRSRIAADGFVAQLQRVTGLDYRVVKVKPGVFEVAFAYGDETEIQANLTQISAATGLEMPES